MHPVAAFKSVSVISHWDSPMTYLKGDLGTRTLSSDRHLPNGQPPAALKIQTKNENILKLKRFKTKLTSLQT